MQNKIYPTKMIILKGFYQRVIVPGVNDMSIGDDADATGPFHCIILHAENLEIQLYQTGQGHRLSNCWMVKKCSK
ncbi:MAG: hypothetical protein BA870_00160 [Desulfuromonadales bacterium C00003094]|nr:MAG: hypothetical protein BA870_00160 [Desulfuromonadales bacterium C00003094]